VGCDIHIVLERKLGNDWVGIKSMDSIQLSQLDIHLNGQTIDTAPTKQGWSRAFYKLTGRDYSFFAAIAGVRGDESDESQLEPRGLPDDLSLLSRYYLSDENGDLHSHSWLSLNELAPILLRVKEGIGVPELVADKLTDNVISEHEVLQRWVVDSYESEVDSFRIVFAFDN
jgi:hypothetical protein